MYHSIDYFFPYFEFIFFVFLFFSVYLFLLDRFTDMRDQDASVYQRLLKDLNLRDFAWLAPPA